MSPRPRRTSPRALAVLVAGLLAAACAADATTDDGEVRVTAPGTVPAEDQPAPAAGSTTDVASTTVTSAAVDPTASTTPSPATTATTATTESRSADCRRLTDFDASDGEGWFVVNDGVMGGDSAGMVGFDAGAMRFTGTVVTAGGGFTSVRIPIDGELAGTDRVELRFRPDGRTYAVTLETDSRIDGRFVSYGAELSAGQPSGADGWRVATVRYDQLATTVFGSPVEAPPFDADATTEFGVIIADGVDGGFAVDIDWIDACG